MGISPRNHIQDVISPPPQKKKKKHENEHVVFSKNSMGLEDDSTHKRTCRFFFKNSMGMEDDSLPVKMPSL